MEFTSGAHVDGAYPEDHRPIAAWWFRQSRSRHVMHVPDDDGDHP
jgi:hypothetical protein